MQLSLLEYLHGTVTGYYPGTSRQDRALTEDEQMSIDWRLVGSFHIVGSTTRLELRATTLTEEPEGIVGIFQDKEGRNYAGTWNDETKTFVGMRLPFRNVAGAKIEYQSLVTAYPPGATALECESWNDEGRPIFLSMGTPTRHVSSSSASIFTWRKLHDGKFGWVQDPD